MSYTDEVFDQEVDTRPRTLRGEVAERTSAQVNPITGHGRGCQCPRCPGWYDSRAAVAARNLENERLVPQQRPANPLFDQVIPVCILMAMVTVCGLILLPVVVPLVAISTLMIVALAMVIVAGAVAVTVGLRRVDRR